MAGRTRVVISAGVVIAAVASLLAVAAVRLENASASDLEDSGVAPATVLGSRGSGMLPNP